MDEMLNLIVKEKTEFNELVRRHPRKIPLSDMATFLKMKEENLRIAIEQRAIPGAFHTESRSGIRAFYIKPVPFMLWYFNINAKTV